MENRVELVDFKAQQGTVFQVVLSEDQTFDLVLHKIEERETPDDDVENFSLIFRSSKDGLLESNTYIVNHGILGSTAIFLTAVGETREAFEYQALFHRKKVP